MTMNSTGRKNRIIGTVSFGGKAGGLLFRLRHAHVAIFLRQHPHGGAERRAVALRLLQGEANRLHAFQPDALRQVVVSLPAIRQIRQFGGRQRELFGKLDRLRADFVADFLKRRLDRHSGFDADQQQIERVREMRA